MPFELFEIPAAKSELTKGTIKNYKTQLNKLADEGHDTREKLLKNKKAIIKYVSNTENGLMTDKAKHKKRVIMSAIFYALGDEPKTKLKMYHKFFQTLYPTYQNDGQTPWMDKTEYKNQKKED
jgi:hypothetical protein